MHRTEFLQTMKKSNFITVVHVSHFKLIYANLNKCLYGFGSLRFITTGAFKIFGASELCFPGFAFAAAFFTGGGGGGGGAPA